MSNRSKVIPFILAVLILTLGGSGCQMPGGLEFLQDSTPYPTYTPYPSPERWDVQVLSATRSTSFGDLYYEDSTNTTFYIVTIQYTYLGKDTAQFFPMSVLLLFPENSSYAGGAYTVGFYQPEDTTAVQNFINVQPPIIFMQPGETRIEKFAWGFLTTMADTRFKILFPETEPIDFEFSGE
jgi:hypothetical protein